MDTKAIQKNYARLTPRERIALILAAAVRKDEKELAQLEATRGQRNWIIPEGTGVADGFFTVANAYAITQLGTAADMLLLMVWSESEDGRDGIDSSATLRVAAYRFIQTRDAWRDFYEGLGIVQDAAEGFLATLADTHSLWITEKVATEIAATEEEARANFDAIKEKIPGASFVDGLGIVTRSTILKKFNDMYATRAARWGDA